MSRSRLNDSQGGCVQLQPALYKTIWLLKVRQEWQQGCNGYCNGYVKHKQEFTGCNTAAKVAAQEEPQQINAWIWRLL